MNNKLEQQQQQQQKNQITIENHDELQCYQNIKKQIKNVFDGIDCEGYKIGNIKDPITGLLSNLQSPSVIYGQDSNHDNPDIKVDGECCGTMFDIDIEKLISKASPAPFGKGNQTVFDESVRKGLQIEGQRIRFDISLPITNLSGITSRGYVLVPKLYKIHIYQEGGFFESHVDTPHGNNHVGTLILPLGVNTYTGGDLVVQPICASEKQQVFHLGNDKNEYSWVAFYNDCIHKVLPVKSGTRIVAQYDLFQFSFFSSMEQKEGFTVNRDVPDCVENLQTTDLVEELKKRETSGNMNICLLLRHKYKCNVEPDNLKGVDSLLWSELKKSFQVSLSNFLMGFSPSESLNFSIDFRPFKPLSETTPKDDSDDNMDDDIDCNPSGKRLYQMDDDYYEDEEETHTILYLNSDKSGYEQLYHKDYQEYTGNESALEVDIGITTGLMEEILLKSLEKLPN
eukprot:gene8079-9940_t